MNVGDLAVDPEGGALLREKVPDARSPWIASRLTAAAPECCAIAVFRLGPTTRSNAA
jgi:hypothetical protein